jgi:tRNA(Ile)-lysidine synthase
MSDDERRLLAGRHPLAAELAVSLRERCQIVGGRILVAVSGGPDSLALLWLASALADRADPRSRWEPIVAHVDHGLRAGSAIEERFVESQALAAGLSYESATVDCRGPGNVSDRARRARYEALERIARARGCVAIVTAHHAEDRLESILIGLGRGRGLEAFLAMPATRPIGDGRILARPLLGVSNAALLECCRRLELAPIRDPSNADPRRLRARLRQVVMPELEAILPGASVQAGAIVEESSLAAAAIERWLAESFGSASTSQWSRETLATLPRSLRIAGLSRAVREALRERDPAAIREVHRRSLEAIADAIGDQERRPRCWPLGALLEAEVDHHHVVLRRRARTGQGDGDSQGPRHAAT